MISCLSSLENALGSDCLGWEIPAGLPIVGGIYYALRWLHKHTVYRDDNFELSVLNHLPLSGYSDPIVSERSLKILPLKPQKLCLEVRARYGFSVKSINFRCIERREIGTGIPVKSSVQIETVKDPFNRNGFRVFDDGYNGIEGEYLDVRGLGKGRCLYYEVALNPQVEWSVLLSFKARDNEGFCSYGRYAIEIRKGAIERPPPIDWEGWVFETTAKKEIGVRLH